VLPTPLATSVQTDIGNWATLPMGRLDEPLNTFWQLLYQPGGRGSWSDQVEATATATNGGLVLSPGGRDVVVGVLPSVNLKYTPLVTTADPGRSWSTGLIDAAVAPRPDALAGDEAGQGLALIAGHDGAKVLHTDGDLSSWQPLVSQASLAKTSAGRSCALATLTAVGYLGSQPLVGGSCDQAGVVGLFTPAGATWRLAGPSLPGAARSGDVEVLALHASGGITGVLLAVGNRSGTALVAAWSSGDQHWATSDLAQLRRGERVTSIGPADGADLFVLLQEASGHEVLMVAGRPTGWAQLPSPPPGTATVAFGPGGTDALTATVTVLTVWSLGSGARSWARRQTMHVPVQFGSSS
jgi:hypothetical protein